jgi:selenide,water dikinase
MKRLILLGGGHAHVHVLRDLAREPLAGAEAMLITPFVRQFYSGMLPGLVAGHYTADDCAIPLAPLAQAARMPLLEHSAVAIDAAARRVLLADGRSVDYDLLSVDTGAVIHRDALPGAREHGLFVRPIEHFVSLLDALYALAARRVLDVVVIGGGAAGVELAMALRHRLGGQARLALLTGGPPPLAGYTPAVMRRVARALQTRGIQVLEQACTAIEADHVLLADGTRLACNAPVLATGVSAPRWLAGSGLALDARGFIATGATLQSTSHPEVFAVGDVATRSDAPHPKSGVYAVRAGPPLALNLRRFIDGSALQRYQPQRRSLNLLATGEQRAIVSWGPLAAEGGWAWRWKDRIDRGFVARFKVAPV